jgi:3D-(3,5/4)-trihydroxycyclohexane-1,2-dione acylhydrolase (decyclizing)
MTTIRLTMAQALVRFLAAQRRETETGDIPLFHGVWAIFGHGNVAGLGEALQAAGDNLPTYRAHNEQAMAHAAIAYAKATNRRQMMACTTSIGPGATNMVTAAALAHVNRLPVLLLPGDVFAGRLPDPVLQQIEAPQDPTISANDCFRPVSRYWDRITRPEQLLTSLPRAMAVLTDPAECGPVTLALCQDVQAEAFDWPEEFFAIRVWRDRRQPPDSRELDDAVMALKTAERPMIIAGGGVLYSGAAEALAGFAEKYGLPVAETQAGKGCLVDSHECCLGSVGVTGTSAANDCAGNADVVLAIGTRLQDFTSGSRRLFARPDCRIIQLNAAAQDLHKHGALPLQADALAGLVALDDLLNGWQTDQGWQSRARQAMAEWREQADAALTDRGSDLPSDAEVIGAVGRFAGDGDSVVCAAGGLPGELHKLWRSQAPGSYHLEYGFSCMGYEIAGGLGVRMAKPDGEVIVMVGDGSYLMMNSEIATSVMLGQKLIITVLDNSGFGCINRLQRATGGESFNNLLADARHETLPAVDFRSHAESLGAIAIEVSNIAELESALARSRENDRTTVIVIRTDPLISTDAGGAWWDVAVPEVSGRQEVLDARKEYEQATVDRLAKGWSATQGKD